MHPWSPEDWNYYMPFASLVPSARRVLIVEDDPFTQNLLAGLVKSIDQDIKVTSVESEEEARAILNLRTRSGHGSGEHPFDLVIVDISLSGKGSGYDLREFISERYPKVPFVFVSGTPVDEFLRTIGKNEICPPYLPKPLFPGETKQVLRELLRIEDAYAK